jgi:hypothetical protein
MTALLATLEQNIDTDGGNGTLAVGEPAGLQSAELLLSQWTNFNSSGATAPGAVADFTDIIATYGTTNQKCRVQYRIADGTEGPTYTSTMPTSQYNDGKIVRIVGAHATTPIDGSNSTSGTATSVTFPAVTTSADYCSAFAFVSGGVDIASAAQTPPAGWVLIHTWGSAGGTNNYNVVFWKPLGLSGDSTGTSSFAFGSSNEHCVSVVTVAPAASTGIHFVRLAGQAQNLTSQAATAVDMPSAASIAADNYLLDLIACDNAGTNGAHALTAPTDTQSHSWGLLTPANADPGAANAGATAAIARVKVVNAFSNGDDANVNFSPNTTAKAVLVFEATGIHTGTPLAVAETQVTASSTTLSISRTPTAAGQMVLGVLAIEGPTGDTFTPDVDNTDGAWGILGRLSTTSGTAASNQTVWAVCKIVTGTSAQTWNPTIGTSRDIAAVMAVFDVEASSTDATATPAVVTTAVEVSAPTVATGASTTPTVVTAAVSVPAPSVSTATNASATPATVTATVEVSAPTVATGASSAPSTVTATVEVLAPSVQAGSDAAATPAAVTATVSVPAPTVSASTDAAATPATVTATVTVLAPTVATGAGATPAVVTATVSVPAPQVLTGRFPVAVSGNSRYLVDGGGDPWFGVGDTAWSLAVQLTTAEITQYLEDRAGRGVNFVLFNAVEHLFSSQSPRWENVNGDVPFSGTAFQTSLVDAYWDHVEFIVSEAARLGVTCLICPAYLGFAGSEEGWDTEIAAATNGQMTTYGEALVARFSSYPNIVWLIGHDQSPDATEQAREAALSDALQAGTAHLVTVGGVEQEGSAAWSGSGVDYDFDTVYFRSTEAPAQQTQDGWANSPTMPTGYLEGLYEGDGSGATRNRNQMWGPLCSGATYIFFGNNPIWNFEAPDWASSGTWEAALDDEGSLDLGVFADFVASLGGSWSGMVPDTTDTFLTVGEGTGASRASARFDADGTSGVLGVAYRPDGGSASLTFDLTEFTGLSTVRIRKFDPSSAAYTTIGTFATSGTQAVSSLGTNAAGDGDWVIVFEASPDATATPAVVTANVAVLAPTVATGASTAPSTVTAAVSVLAPTVATGTTAAPSTVTATVEVLAPGVSAAGSATAAPNTVNLAVSVLAPTVTTGAAATPGVVTATVEVSAPSVSITSTAAATPATVTVTVAVLNAGVIAGTIILSADRTHTPRAETRTVTPRVETRTHIVEGP